MPTPYTPQGTPVTTRTLSGQDAIARVALSKINVFEVIQGTQSLVVAGAINNTTGLTSLNMGHPETVTLFLTASAAATYAVWLSPDGVNYFHDSSLDVIFAGAGDKVTRLNVGAAFVRIIPTVAQVTGSIVIQPNYA